MSKSDQLTFIAEGENKKMQVLISAISATKTFSLQTAASGWPAAAAAAKSLQSYPTLCDPIDGSPPGSPVPGILQARTLEWGAIAFSDICH